jgi:hypothetical protein
MTERREVVVGSVLQAHQLQQYLNSAGVDWRSWPLTMTQTRVEITAESEQWTGINQWLQRIGVQS